MNDSATRKQRSHKLSQKGTARPRAKVGHEPPEPIRIGSRSVMYWWKSEPVGLCVFLHGLLGNSISTWVNFNRLAPDSEPFAHSDILFYGYDSLAGSAEHHAASFLNDVGMLVERQAYKQVVIIAHSLGSLVARRALQDATRAGVFPVELEWRLILYAPAHQVTNINEMLAPSLFMPLSIFQAASRLGLVRYPVLRDLLGKSAFMESLKERQRTLLASGTNSHLNARLVVHGTRDRVVDQTAWMEDPRAVFLDANHTTVCKPEDMHDSRIMVLSSAFMRNDA